MSITISDIKSRIASKIHGHNIDNVSDFFGLCLEAAGNVLNATDPKETRRVAQITNALYDQVYDYIAPTDLKDEAICDIRVQGERTFDNNFSQFGNEEFDIRKTNQSIAVRVNSGVKTLRISKSLEAGLVLDTADSVTANGTWAAGGNATTLSADTFNKVSGSASLKFNISASGSTAYLENSTLTAVDLSSVKDAGAVFVWAYIPSSAVTSVNLRWGSSSADYYSVTVTSTQDNTAFIVGWNLLRFDWVGLTPTGTPVDTAIDYARVTFAYDGTAVTSCRIDNIIAKQGFIYEIDYYSSYLFRTTGGTWIEKPTLDIDIVNLGTTSVNLFIYELGELIAQELSGEDSSFDVQYWTNKKKEEWQKYTGSNKSDRMKRQSTYYRMPRR